MHEFVNPMYYAIGAVLSAVIGAIIALVVARKDRLAKLDMQDQDTLERQLGARDRALSEMRQQNIDLRDLKYELMLKIENLKHENNSLQEELNGEQLKNVSLHEQILKLEEESHD